MIQITCLEHTTFGRPIVDAVDRRGSVAMTG